MTTADFANAPCLRCRTMVLPAQMQEGLCAACYRATHEKIKETVPSRPGFQRWVVAFEVADILVGDGFDPDDDTVRTMLTEHLPYANISTELGVCEVIAQPNRDIVAQLQGYKDAAERKAAK